jgi:glycosyltransferase involved in cell wall biosynthesis
VSIIVPAYNVEKYIRECLESLVEQTYRNVEIIVVDDGSRDGTWAIISEFMKNDSRIRGFRQDNKGVSAARNFALKKACGYYIQFVDADDYLARDAVEKLVRAIEIHYADWVNFQYYRVDENGKPLDDYNFTNGVINLSDDESKLVFIRDILIEYLVGYEIWDKLYSAEIIKKANLKFDENCHMGEDLEFNICYSLFAKSVVCLEDRLYYYRVRSDSAMRSIIDLPANLDERMVLIEGAQKSYEKCTSKSYVHKFYQIFYKLFLYVSKGYSALEVAEAVKDLERRDFLISHLSEALSHKSEFESFLSPEMASIYWRYGYYILSHFTGSIIGKIYFWVYNAYRILRGRESITHWKLC